MSIQSCQSRIALGSQPSLRIHFDPALMETVVTRALAAAAVLPAGFTSQAFHAETDRIYQLSHPNERSLRFLASFARWFRRGQFDRPVADALAELPDVEKAVSLVTVTGAGSRAEERADLATASGAPLSAGPAAYWLGISIQPARFLDRPILRRWLRHELWHVRDMLDPAFAYGREDFTAGAAERLPQRVVQDRYALLWSLSIDARVECASQLPLYSKGERRARLVQAFPAFAPQSHAAIMATIGISRGISHPELLEFARWPQKLLGQTIPSGNLIEPLRGSPCPLCRFPTFHWSDLRAPHLEPILQSIRQAYPSWDRSLGLCVTCLDRFSIRAGVWS